MNAKSETAKKPARTRKPANDKPVFDAKGVQTALVAALDARIKFAAEKGIQNQVKNLEAEKRFFESANMCAAIEKLNEYGFDALPFAAMLANNEDMREAKQIDKTQFVAVYALQKVRKAMFAIAQGLRSGFDSYTNSIVDNLTRLQTISNINTQRSICKSIEFAEDEQQVLLRRKHECSPSTASTQASSTREMLRFLTICTVNKGSKGDSIAYAENAIAKRVQAMFAD